MADLHLMPFNGPPWNRFRFGAVSRHQTSHANDFAL
jgi:hypothetical protein